MNRFYQNIVVGIDLGPHTLSILRRAIFHASDKTTVHIVYCIEPKMLTITQLAQTANKDAHMQQKAENQLQQLCQNLSCSHKRYVIHGNPSQEILTIAKQQQADLICMGNVGIGGRQHMLGSTTLETLNHATCDVLTINTQTLPTASTRASEPAKHIESQEQHHYIGSKKGFGDPVSKGPRCSPRPKGTPYRGGSRNNKEQE